MNRNNKILVGILTFIVAMTIGYAIFSDKITVTGIAKAKGNFDISFTCTAVTSENATSDDINNGLVTMGGTGTCSIEGQKITTTSSLTKPDDQVIYKVILINNGTIPAKIKEVNSSNNCLNDSNIDKTCPGDEVYFDKTNMLAAGYGIGKLNDDGTIDETSIMTGDSAIEGANIVLQPGKSMVMYLYSFWLDSHTETQAVIPEEGATINYNAELLFEQITD